MSCPGLLKTTPCAIAWKEKSNKKNVKFSLNFRKCKFKEIKKVKFLYSDLCAKRYKIPPPPRRYRPH